MILLICLGWLATNSFNLGLNQANSVSLARKGVRGYIMNVFFVGIIATFVFWAINGFKLKESFFVFEKRDYANVVLRTVSSNCVALLSMAAVARLDMIIYTPVASAISVVGSVIVAVIFKQKLNLFSYLALLFALISLSVVSFIPA